MIWRSRRGWVLRVRDDYAVVTVLGIELETYAPATFVIGERTYFVDHCVEDGELVARTAVDVRWGACHEMSVLEQGLVEDVTPATRRHLRALRTSSILLRETLDDLDGRIPRSDVPGVRIFVAEAPPRPISDQLKVWRSRRGSVVRVSEQFYVLDHERRLIEVHAPDQFIEGGRTYFVDHYVKYNELIRRTSVDQRWGEWYEKLAVEHDLHEELAEGALPFVPSSPLAYEQGYKRWARLHEDEPARFKHLREAEEELAGPPAPAPVKAPILRITPEVERAMQCLLEMRDALCSRMLGAMRALAEEGSTFAMTALARASLLYLKESNVPAIDETWAPIQSPLAFRIAKLVDELDERNARDAADAMETCAALLGYRDGFPVLRT